MSVERIRDEAIAWHLRLADAEVPAVAWAEFTDWLEADADHAEAYDAVALADAELGDALALSLIDPAHPQNDNEPSQSKSHVRRGMLAIAASAAIALFASPFLLNGDDFQRYETKIGETRDIRLPDGSHIVLNGGTRLKLNSTSNRFARLDQGEATFTIHHDAENPFVVETEGASLRDLGTIFNVRQDDDGLEVSVAEGAVHYNPRAEAVKVKAGYRLRVARQDPTPVLAKTEATAVGGWRQGRLSFESTPLSDVVVDLTRSLGTPVSISPEISNRRFSGVIQIDRDQAHLFRRIEPLLGVHARHSAKGWQLTP